MSIIPITEKSQCGQLLKHLEGGGSVNYLSAMNQLHIGSGFTRRIADLIAAGHSVIHVKCKSRSGRSYNEYYLKDYDENIKAWLRANNIEFKTNGET